MLSARAGSVSGTPASPAYNMRWMANL